MGRFSCNWLNGFSFGRNGQRRSIHIPWIILTVRVILSQTPGSSSIFTEVTLQNLSVFPHFINGGNIPFVGEAARSSSQYGVINDLRLMEVPFVCNVVVLHPLKWFAVFRSLSPVR